MQAGRYQAGGGLAATIDDEGALRLELGEPDWLGPGRLVRVDGVDATIEADPDAALLTIVLTATVDLDGLATGDFASPAVAWRFEPGRRSEGGIPDGARAFGFQYTEFALPTHSDASLARWWLLPFRPNVVLPLGLTAPDGRTLLLAPLDQFHEQVIAVPRRDDEDGSVRCGWHGDLDVVPAGFTTRLGVLAAPGPRAALDALGRLLQRLHATERRSDADELGRRVSYWTDNGAAYWYRTEPGHDVTSTLVATVSDLRDCGIAVGAVQLDSWFYPHEVVRPFDTDDWEVPPTGLVQWDARAHVLPDGVAALRRALGDPPLVTHCRHLSSASPYVDEHECWIDGDRAHPCDASLYERWLDQAEGWGVRTFEHDWLIECFLGVRGLRAQPGRARSWQEGLDVAAEARGMTLQWCMASPADFLQTVTLRNVTSIRTSGDFAYLVDPGVLWAWFLLVNALARPLGLHPFKDVFHSDRDEPSRHAELEALLSALSTGPVGLGDPLGRADPDVVARTCRADGVIVGPDVPVAALDRCFLEHPSVRPIALVGEAWTRHAAGQWGYVVAVNCHADGAPLPVVLRTDELGEASPLGDVVAWDWRRRAFDPLGVADSWATELAPLDWDFRVLAPVLPCGLAVVGDAARYVTAGRARIAAVEDRGDRVMVGVVGVDETVTVTGWAATPPRAARCWRPRDGWRDLPLSIDGHMWSVDVEVGPTARVDVEVVA